MKIEGFTEEQVAWREDDFRFVQKDGKIYAFIMRPKMGKTAVIKSLKEDEHVNSVRLLGYGSLTFNQYSGVLVVDLPDKLPSPYSNALEIVI